MGLPEPEVGATVVGGAVVGGVVVVLAGAVVAVVAVLPAGGEMVPVGDDGPLGAAETNALGTPVAIEALVLTAVVAALLEAEGVKLSGR
ncbi:MAG: hypothetical protein ACRDYC_03610 [Acidimicrobiales bacterium]